VTRFGPAWLIPVLVVVRVAPATAATIVVTNTNDSGTGSLRWAIEQANSTSGPHQIRVNNSGQFLVTYRPLTELPRVETDTEVFGCCVGGPQTAVIDGSQMSGSGYAGLRLGNRITVRGVVVGGFRDGAGGATGIRMEGMDSILQDVYVGTDAAGTSANGNDTGVVITGSGNSVGYQYPDDREQVIVSGNGVGIAVSSAGSANGNLVRQTWIGLDASGGPLPNTSHGVRISGGNGTLIGGTSFSDHVRIAFNGGAGVVVDGASDAGNAIRGNLIWGNAGGLAIDLGGDGVTANDDGDADVGPNGLQNFPLIASAVWNGGTVQVQGTLTSRPSQSFRVELYATTAVDPSGHGEAERFVGALQVSTDASGLGSFALGVGGMDASMRFLSASATDAAGNTSELSPAVEPAGTPSPQSTYTVNTTDDVSMGVCSSLHCSLREAIETANLNRNGALPDLIAFAIPGNGPHAIALGGFPLDEFVEPVVVDGYTQPGALPNTSPFGTGLNTVLKVGLQCNPNVQAWTLSLPGSSTVRGLAIYQCGSAVVLSGTGNVVEGNFIGTDVTGMAKPQVNVYGVLVHGSSNRVGGTAPESRNLISNNISGVGLFGTDNRVEGNLIGATADGHASLPNSLEGISVQAHRNLIGGLAPGAGNVISGNANPDAASQFGILISGGTGNLVQGNFIGTDVEGDDPLPNDVGVGIPWPQANRNVVGGSAPGAGNVISGNTYDGVVLYLGTRDNVVQGNLIGPDASGSGTLGNGFDGVFVNDATGNHVVANTLRGNGIAAVAMVDPGSASNWITRNAISGSNGLGLDLLEDGVTPNDQGDADQGPNGLQNFPVLTAASPGTIVTGTYNGAANAAITLELFASSAPHASGHGEGERFIGSRSIATDAAGDAVFSLALPRPVTAGEWLSATATDAADNTSEFSAAVQVAEPAFRGVALSVDAAGNGVLEPGETVLVAPSWKNSTGGAVTLSGHAGNLTGPAGPSYVMADDSAAYGLVPQGGSAGCAGTGDCFAMGVHGSRPVSHLDATFDETLGGGSGRTWTLHVGGSFADVPIDSIFYAFVETLFHTGVTVGCGGSSYCPTSPTTREQMAVFVLRAKEGKGYLPRACSAGKETFNDVAAASPYCRWIEELARRGVVVGCGGGAYCPAAPVAREQMAVFVLRAESDVAFQPPDCVAGSERFNDVPAASPYCPWIEELARRNVVQGCGGGAYCPATAVTREQMSVFLTKTFGLLLYGP
jgi:titin